MRLFSKILVLSLFFATFNCAAFANLGAKITLDFRDTDVREIFKVITGSINMGLVIEKSVRGKLTLSIKDTKAIDALDLVAEASGFAWEKRGNNILVTKDFLIDKKVKVFRINHIDVGEAAKILRQTIREDIKISTCKHLDSLVVNAGKKEMDKVMRIISLIDRKSDK
jgi:type II secretory pathway component GspD/PulD (secretin)